MDTDVCIISAVRTPVGAFMGGLSALSATDLGAIAIKGKQYLVSRQYPGTQASIAQACNT